MKISYNWLNEFIDLELSPEEAAEKLTLIGLEVDKTESIGSRLDGVIVGEVLEVREHPNADRLRLCRVDLGEQKVQIVCGADNVAKGQRVPVATIGTILPTQLDSGEPLTIEKTKLRGEVSEGMICSESELGLGTDHSGIMVLENGADIGTPVNEIIDIYRDTVFDIELSPNRPDATCHLGVARDLAAALDLNLNKPFETDLGEADPLDEHIEIRIESEEKCHRYTGKIVKGASVGSSPDWLKNRLKAIGVRPVNNVVDATNYVMYELGQPLHAFDYATIRDKKIIVRDFDKQIEFETLDHVKRNCSPGTLFICDGQGPVAIAGVIGGVDSEVGDETTDILIESAWFDPGTVRKTAKEQNLQTDASYRFERGVDPELQRIAAERCAGLMAELTGGTIVEGCTDAHPVKTEPKQLKLRKSYVNRLLGTDLDIKEIVSLLDGLEFEILAEDDESVTYQVPTFRPDLKREVDLIEEVGRLYDYNRISTPEHVKFLTPEPISDHEKLVERIRDAIKSLRFKEIYSNSLMSDEDAKLLGNLDDMIKTLNPISQDMTTLRPTLLHGFLKTASYNFNRKVKGLRVFEIGNIFRKSDQGTYFEGIREETAFLMGLAGQKTIEHWKTDPQSYDLFDLKAPVNSLLNQLDLYEHIEQKLADEQLVYSIEDTVIGRIFPVDPHALEAYEIEVAAFAAEFSITRIEHILSGLPTRGYEPVSKFPSFEFDLAVVVEKDVPAGELMKQIEKSAGEQLRDIQIFDVFEGPSIGEDRKSIAFRLSFLDKNKTLTINDVEPIINKVLNILENKFSAKLRS